MWLLTCGDDEDGSDYDVDGDLHELSIRFRKLHVDIDDGNTKKAQRRSAWEIDR